MKKYRYFPLEYKQRIVSEVESRLHSKAVVVREEHLACSLIERRQKQYRDEIESTNREIEAEIGKIQTESVCKIKLRYDSV